MCFFARKELPVAVEHESQEDGSFLCGRRVAGGGKPDGGPTNWSIVLRSVVEMCLDLSRMC